MVKKESTNLRKRVICTLLFLFTLTWCALPVAAQSNAMISDLWVSDEGGLTGIMGGYTLFSNANESTIIADGVQYRYSMSDVECGNSYVDLELSISYRSEILNFSLSGQVASAPYNSDTYYEGKLEGEKDINGKKYYATASFQKLKSSENVKVGLVLVPADGDGENLIMIFGDRVLSYDELCAYMTTNSPEVLISEESNLSNDVMPLAAGDEYDFYCSSPMALNQYISMPEAGRMKYSYCPESLRGIQTVTSNCSGVSETLNEQFLRSTVYVHGITMGVDHVSGNGYCAGFEDEVVFPSSPISISQTIREKISDILSWIAGFSKYNIPTFFIDWIESSLSGSIETSGATSGREVVYSFTGMFENFDFDDGALPVTYQFAAGSGGSTIFSCYSSMEYRCTAYDSSGDGVVLYLTTDTVSYPFAFS